MPNENEYTELITGAHRDKPRFTEWVYQLTEPVLNARQDLAYMIKQYDLDCARGRDSSTETTHYRCLFCV